MGFRSGEPFVSSPGHVGAGTGGPAQSGQGDGVQRAPHCPHRTARGKPIRPVSSIWRDNTLNPPGVSGDSVF
jgi:hypothetical protein